MKLKRQIMQVAIEYWAFEHKRWGVSHLKQIAEDVCSSDRARLCFQ